MRPLEFSLSFGLLHSARRAPQRFGKTRAQTSDRKANLLSVGEKGGRGAWSGAKRRSDGANISASERIFISRGAEARAEAGCGPDATMTRQSARILDEKMLRRDALATHVGSALIEPSPW
jgi:hypothetical protein